MAMIVNDKDNLTLTNASTGFTSTPQGGGSVRTITSDTDSRLSNLSIRCANTQQLLGGFTIPALFTGSFKAILGFGKGTLAPELAALITAIEDAIPGTVKLRDFYQADLEGTYPGLTAALDNAEAEFVLPFRYLTPVQRTKAVSFFRDQVPNDPQCFLDAFANYSLPSLFTTKASALDLWQQHLMRQAHDLGALRSHPRTVLMLNGKNECAFRDNFGIWHCQGPSTNDSCNLIDGEPSAATDLC
jgi:hypothetical protein